MLPNPVFNIVVVFILAFVITWQAIPRIIWIATIKNLTDKPGARKLQKHDIPTLGGIGIFAGFFIAFMLMVDGMIEKITTVSAGFMVILFLGIKDDLENLPPYQKLTTELIAAIIVACFSGLCFPGFYETSGLAVFDNAISVVITIGFIIFTMNSFNLIDGIDGLATAIGLFISLMYGLWFFFAGDFGYSILCASLAGALSAFLPFNLSKGRRKIFMGDTGSLCIGFLLSVMTIRFVELNDIQHTTIKFHNPQLISLSLLIIPYFDTIRVIIIRLKEGRHPFSADQNHMHHRLLRLGLSHNRATLALVMVNGVIFLIAVLINDLHFIYSMLVITAICLSLSRFSLLLEKKRVNKNAIIETVSTFSLYAIFSIELFFVLIFILIL